MSVEPSAFLEFSQTPFREVFWERHYQTLRFFLESFLKCHVSIVHNPMARFLEQYGVDILENPGRTLYPNEHDRMLVIVGADWEGKGRVFMGLDIHEPQLALPTEAMGRAIAGQLQRQFKKGIERNFDVDLQSFGQDLVLDLIVSFLERGGFERYHLRLLFKLFMAVRTLTFEDRPFNTGLILTHSHRTYSAEKRAGFLAPLKEPTWIRPTQQFKKRFWFLVDGSTCFFLSDRNLQVNSMFFLNQEDCGSSAISTFFLKEALHDRDLAFRTVQGKEMVAVAASGEEFTYTGTQWHFRDYSLIRKTLGGLLPQFSPHLLETLLELIFIQMTERNGSLIWIPEKLDDIETMTIQSTQLWDQGIVIEPRYGGLIQRLASSDGALVIGPRGKIQRFGAVANMTSAIGAGTRLTGSGSIAARFFSQSGVAIKVSQDGTGRVYAGGEMRWVI